MNKVKPIKTYTMDGIKYGVSLKNLAIDTFESISNISFTQVLMAFNSAQGLNEENQIIAVFNKITYRNMLEMIYASMICAKRIDKTLNPGIDSFEDLVEIDLKEDTNIGFNDFFNLFKLCFETINIDHARSLVKRGKQ